MSLKMKNIIALTFILTLIFNVGYSQTKKEKIQILTFQIDSLTQVINSKMINLKNKDTVIWELENQIQLLNAIIEKRKLDENVLKESMYKKDIELQIKNNEILHLDQVIFNLRDSINNSIQKVDSILWEIPNLTWNSMESSLKLFIPAFKFTSPIGKLLISNDQKIIISYDYNFTHWWEDDANEHPLFYKEKDAINYYSKDLFDIELSYKNEGFVIKGRDATNQLIMIKGLYSDFSSMRGQELGKPMWLWSNTLIIKVSANQKDKEEFKYISDMVINNFTNKSIISKFE
jgi:hypothetical protein